jgi:hypothetical protein
LEIVLPLYSLAVLIHFYQPDFMRLSADGGVAAALMPWALWGVVGAMSGVLALSGLVVAFFLMYSPLYLLARSRMLVGEGKWVDRREFRFYLACFILLCFLVGLAVWSPLVAASTFVVLAGCAHFVWRILA